MGGEISEKTQEDIDEPTIPPSPMIDQGMGNDEPTIPPRPMAGRGWGSFSSSSSNSRSYSSYSSKIRLRD